MQADRVAKLGEFTEFVAAHIRGDEKGEAQVFLDRLFRAFGHPGAKEAGATFEERIKKVRRPETHVGWFKLNTGKAITAVGPDEECNYTPTRDVLFPPA